MNADLYGRCYLKYIMTSTSLEKEALFELQHAHKITYCVIFIFWLEEVMKSPIFIIDIKYIDHH